MAGGAILFIYGIPIAAIIGFVLLIVIIVILIMILRKKS